MLSSQDASLLAAIGAPLLLAFLASRARRRARRRRIRRYWERHERLYPGRSRSSEEWASLREEILERDGGRCRRCGATESLQVDHVQPLSRGGSNKAKNLQALCRPCHEEKSGRRFPEFPR